MDNSLHYREQEVIEYLNKAIKFCNINKEDYYNIFHYGVMWEHNNPNWNKFPDNPPKENKDYLVAFKDKVAIMTWQDDKFIDELIEELEEYWNINTNCNKFIIAWMELPKSPKFELMNEKLFDEII